MHSYQKTVHKIALPCKLDTHEVHKLDTYVVHKLDTYVVHKLDTHEVHQLDTHEVHKSDTHAVQMLTPMRCTHNSRPSRPLLHS